MDQYSDRSNDDEKKKMKKRNREPLESYGVLQNKDNIGIIIVNIVIVVFNLKLNIYSSNISYY